jgi:ABC-type transport system substrate-binding protein
MHNSEREEDRPMKNKKRLFLISALFLSGAVLAACGTNSNCSSSSQSTPEYTLISASDIIGSDPVLANGQRAITPDDWSTGGMYLDVSGFTMDFTFPKLDHTKVHDVYDTIILYDKNKAFLSRGVLLAKWHDVRDPDLPETSWYDTVIYNPGLTIVFKCVYYHFTLSGIVDI